MSSVNFLFLHQVEMLNHCQVPFSLKNHTSESPLDMRLIR
uniref:Uncharacterized protein n=1 Tax=Arundo donax TaxID=35708 RepID=A0A0A9F8B7_ARUDO